jgi:general secretion pathway protein B
MSYILEALKKADQERMVGEVPDLDSIHDPEVRPARRTFRWIWILGALLVVNGILVAALMLRKDVTDDGPEPATAERDRPPVTTPSSRRLPPRQPAVGSTVQPYVPPVPATPAPADKPATTPGSPVTPQVAGTVTRAEQPLEVEAPASEGPAPVPAPVSRPPVSVVQAPASPPAKSAEGLPYWNDLSLEFRSGFTAPRIDVHVYDTDPQRRFILVDLKKYREGDRLASGARLEKITPEGVQLSFQGKQFIYRQ